MKQKKQKQKPTYKEAVEIWDRLLKGRSYSKTKIIHAIVCGIRLYKPISLPNWLKR